MLYQLNFNKFSEISWRFTSLIFYIKFFFDNLFFNKIVFIFQQI